MPDNDTEIVAQLTKTDCTKIVEYVQWLEEKVGDYGFDIGGRFAEVQDHFQKIIDGKFK